VGLCSHHPDEPGLVIRVPVHEESGTLPNDSLEVMGVAR
jgi:hypothetical protein